MPASGAVRRTPKSRPHQNSRRWIYGRQYMTPHNSPGCQIRHRCREDLKAHLSLKWATKTVRDSTGRHSPPPPTQPKTRTAAPWPPKKVHFPEPLKDMRDTDRRSLLLLLYCVIVFRLLAAGFGPIRAIATTPGSNTYTHTCRPTASLQLLSAPQRKATAVPRHRNSVYGFVLCE